MQQVKIYKTAMFKGEARFDRDSKKMAKVGWRVQTVTDKGVGTGQDHTGQLTVVYQK